MMAVPIPAEKVKIIIGIIYEAKDLPVSTGDATIGTIVMNIEAIT